MKVLICGGRNFGHSKWIRLTLDHLLPRGNYTIIEGGAGGVDWAARTWAIHRGYEVMTFYAEWNVHGKAAGPIRNQRMIDEGRPQKVIAFPGGRGTKDLVRRADKAGIEVVEVKFKRNELNISFKAAILGALAFPVSFLLGFLLAYLI